jgi:succinyl-CoA synthetase beta subunit
MWWETDASMVEINPLIIHPDKTRCSRVDAKVSFDDNALFRHPDIVAMRDLNEEDAEGDRGLASSTSATSRSTATSPAS